MPLRLPHWLSACVPAVLLLASVAIAGVVLAVPDIEGFYNDLAFDFLFFASCAFSFAFLAAFLACFSACFAFFLPFFSAFLAIFSAASLAFAFFTMTIPIESLENDAHNRSAEELAAPPVLPRIFRR